MNDQALNIVKLTGSGDGLKVIFDPSQPQNFIKKELEVLFKNLKHLALNAKVVIDTDGVEGYDHIIENIKTYLRTTYKVGEISTFIPKQEVRKETNSIKSSMLHRSDVLMLKGWIRSGQKVESKNHVIIAGDVNPGAEIISGGDVIILGRLKGKVHAGFPDKKDAIIFALEFNPTQIKIADIIAVEADETSASKKSEFASIYKNGIIVQDYLKANPFATIPWPETL